MKKNTNININVIHVNANNGLSLNIILIPTPNIIKYKIKKITNCTIYPLIFFYHKHITPFIFNNLN